MSLQTTLARAEADAADGIWQRHRKTCHVCGPVARKRQYDQLCPDGKAALQDRNDLRDAAEREALLDKQPMPGQDAMFTPAECGARHA